MAHIVAFTTRIEREDRIPVRREAGPVVVPGFAVAFEAARFAGVEESGGGYR